MLNNLGTFYWGVQDYKRAVESLSEALSVARQLANVRKMIAILYNLGTIYLDTGRYADAEAALMEGLQRVRNADMPIWQVAILTNLGQLRLDQQDIVAARAYWEEAEQLAQELDNPHVVASVHLSLGQLARIKGDIAQAIEKIREAFAMAQKAELLGAYLFYRSELAVCYLVAGQKDEAMQLSTKTVVEMEGEDQVGGFESRAIYLNHWKIMKVAGEDILAREALEKAYALVQAEKETLPDPDWQRAFLENIPVHREIAAAYEQWQAEIRAGQVTVELPAADATQGGPLDPEQLVTVTWTVRHPDDEMVSGKKSRRHHRLLRLLSEAEAQGAVATVQDLADALAVSERTMRYDLKALREAGHHVVTRGNR